MHTSSGDRILRQSGSTLRLVNGTVIKSQSPELSRCERKRTQFGARVAAASGLFDVPEIVTYDDTGGTITFRYAPDAVPLSEYLVHSPEPKLMERVGRSLAAIHNASLRSTASKVRWHGDYGLNNILYTESCDQLTIIDWANAIWAPEPACKSNGTAGLDLGIALISLFHHWILGPKYIRSPERLGGALLRAYVSDRQPFTLTQVIPYVSQLIGIRQRLWRSQPGILRVLAYTPSLLRLRLYLSLLQFKGV